MRLFLFRPGNGRLTGFFNAPIIGASVVPHVIIYDATVIPRADDFCRPEESGLFSIPHEKQIPRGVYPGQGEIPRVARNDTLLGARNDIQTYAVN